MWEERTCWGRSEPFSVPVALRPHATHVVEDRVHSLRVAAATPPHTKGRSVLRRRDNAPGLTVARLMGAAAFSDDDDISHGADGGDGAAPARRRAARLCGADRRVAVAEFLD